MRRPVQLVHRGGGWCGAARRGEGRDVALGQAAEVELLEPAVAAQVVLQAQQRGFALGPPVGAEHEQLGASGARDQLADEPERRAVRPLQVVEHERESLLGHHAPEHGRERDEQPVPAGFGVVPHRRPFVRQQRLELRQQHRERGDRGGQALVGAQAEPRTVDKVLAKGLDERLVWDQPLLVRAPEQHGPVVGMQPSGRFREQPRLPDARIAGDEDEPAPAGERARDLRDRVELVRAADQRRRTGALERRRQREERIRRRRARGHARFDVEDRVLLEDPLLELAQLGARRLRELAIERVA